MHAEFGEQLPTWKSTMHLYSVDGAVHDVGPDETAFAYRDVMYSTVIAGVDPDPASLPALRDWCVDWEAQHPYSAGGAYVSFMMAEGPGPGAGDVPGPLPAAGSDQGGL